MRWSSQLALRLSIEALLQSRSGSGGAGLGLPVRLHRRRLATKCSDWNLAVADFLHHGYRSIRATNAVQVIGLPFEPFAIADEARNQVPGELRARLKYRIVPKLPSFSNSLRGLGGSLLRRED